MPYPMSAGSPTCGGRGTSPPSCSAIDSFVMPAAARGRYRRSRVDRVDADTVSGEPLCGVLREGPDGALRGRVRRPPASETPPTIAAMDDTLTIEPPPCRCMCGMTDFMPSQTPVAFTAMTVFQSSSSASRMPLAMWMPRVVDEHVDTPVFGHHLLDDRRPRSGRGHVERERGGMTSLVADRGSFPLQCRFADVGHDDPRALACEQLGSGEAHAARCTGDDRDLVVESCHVVSPVLGVGSDVFGRRMLSAPPSMKTICPVTWVFSALASQARSAAGAAGGAAGPFRGDGLPRRGRAALGALQRCGGHRRLDDPGCDRVQCDAGAGHSGSFAWVRTHFAIAFLVVE